MPIEVRIPSADFNGNLDKRHKFIYKEFNYITTHQNRTNDGILWCYNEQNSEFVVRVVHNKTVHIIEPIINFTENQFFNGVCQSILVKNKSIKPKDGKKIRGVKIPITNPEEYLNKFKEICEKNGLDIKNISIIKEQYVPIKGYKKYAPIVKFSAVVKNKNLFESCYYKIGIGTCQAYGFGMINSI